MISYNMKMVILLLVPLSLSGQVSNDNIEDRIKLFTNGPSHTSNTSNCTVQWECVDQSLTGKCVQYHNDQWFYFNNGIKKNLYININNQNCRDIRGIQLVVVSGIPCEPSTYIAKACVSLGNQDDIFLHLDSLAPDTEYLLNVDGYLHDFCEFTIEISEAPEGIPVQLSQNEIDYEFIKKENIVNMSWKVTESENYQYYRVYRWKNDQPKSEFIAEIQHEKNAYGVSKLDYSYPDTITESGLYNYKIFGSTPEGTEHLLINKQIKISNHFHVNSDDKELINGKIEIELDFPDKTPLTVLLINRTQPKNISPSRFPVQQRQ